jgi:hypothetical protein
MPGKWVRGSYCGLVADNVGRCSLGTGSVQFQTHGMEKISAKDKPCSIMPKATAGTCLVVK